MIVSEDDIGTILAPMRQRKDTGAVKMKMLGGASLSKNSTTIKTRLHRRVV